LDDRAVDDQVHPDPEQHEVDHAVAVPLDPAAQGVEPGGGAFGAEAGQDLGGQSRAT
jgi:hypothetical protein